MCYGIGYKMGLLVSILLLHDFYSKRKVCRIGDRGTHVCCAVTIVASVLFISGRLLPTLYRNSNTHARVPGKKG
jgi:prolipoprotein diacylglyceryltransferase